MLDANDYVQILKAELKSSLRLAEIGLAVAAHAEHLQEQVDSVNESLAAELKSERSRAAQLELEVDALQTDRNEHVCHGPVVGNIVQSPAQRDRENELRRDLQEAHQMLQSHGATIKRLAETNEKLKAEAARDRRELVAALDGRQAAIERLDVARAALKEIAEVTPASCRTGFTNKIEKIVDSAMQSSEPLKTEAGDNLLTVLSKVRSDCERAKADAARLQAELETIRAADAQRAQESAACDDLLSDRDRFYDMAESLADAAADLLNVNIGEHSNINDPHRNALDAIKAAHVSPYGEIINGPPDVVRLQDDLQASEAARESLERLTERIEVKLDHIVGMCRRAGYSELRDEVDVCIGLLKSHNERTVTE